MLKTSHMQIAIIDLMLDFLQPQELKEMLGYLNYNNKSKLLRSKTQRKL